MKLLNLFGPPLTKPKLYTTPFAGRLDAIKRGIDEYNNACLAHETARGNLIGMAEELYKPYQLIFAEYKGYGIIVRREYNFDFLVNVITYQKSPALDKDQLYTTQLIYLRPVYWDEVLAHESFHKWINKHPLSAQIHEVNNGK